MNNLKIINNKISAIQKTKQITRAMEMVAITKIIKIKRRINNINPFINNIYNIINVITMKNFEYSQLYSMKRKIKRVVFFIISSDRGLCGNLNLKLFDKILLKIQYLLKKNIEIDLIIIGNKGYLYFAKLGFNIIDYLININHNLLLSDLTNITNILIDLYVNKKIDRLYLAYNKFKNNMCYIPLLNTILPLSLDIKLYNDLYHKWNYIYEFRIEKILNDLIFKYVKSNIFCSILKNMLSEQSSRALVMKNATDNSINFIKKLRLIYNNIRQNKITQELTEIVSGSSFIVIYFFYF
ncbi:ATP synthase F1 subunit gamma [Candidatus Purcelliella pentastirinorum]|uniref:ATP synthase gamma chain n=1 Tax=Candidatus Purcelliella pentastirinorum TaxID=472834 RepID=A0A346DZT6_9ENTR|nr:ATP synthase F1 subunit gamma [Candidatus Purcelliella pentastirinorum]AXN02241.1 ATP synthase gamma chain [Candidatus Purcelliella pentastirinorum]WDI78796.1 ATP synthase F1 subunit gamma [Candidatus Purcelliella pentastirinorum]WDR79929.1 ATP synthase F1 subunit gamma [Candidatus Purcelliella pentastirinorum]